MAVYAAYRHIELDNVGYGKKRSARPPPNRDIFGAEFKGSPCHLRVLKPPGGGSSDIFGAAGPDEAPRRRVDRNNSSVPVGEEVCETPSRAAKPGNDTHHRLFGEAVNKPPTPYVPKSKINLGFGEGLGNVRLISADQVSVRRNPVTGDGFGEVGDLNRNVGRRIYGNVMKAEGRNGSDAVVKEVTNGDSANANVVDAPSSAPRRGRVPPGGFSSGLW